MPLIYAFSNDGRGIVATAEGRLTGGELLEAQTKANTVDHSTRPILYTFFDFNGVEAVDIATT
jgi:hypothetical protein